MPSEVLATHSQKHGSWVTERHTLDDGHVEERVYFADSKTDIQKMLKINAISVENQRAAQLAREAEQADMEAKRDEALKRLDVDDVADLLMVSREEASREKDWGQDSTEVSRG